MEICVLGPVELVGGTGENVVLPGAKMRGLVAMLALDAGRTVTAQRLIDALWGEQEVNGPNALQVIVSKLRRMLADAGEPGCITTQPAGYRLDIERDSVDALRFESLVDQARSVVDHPASVTALLGPALELWRGNPLVDVPETEIANAMRSRLEELRKVAVDELFDAQLSLGQHQRIVPELEALVAEDPLRERRWGQLIRALYGSGRQADAMRAYQRARDVLIEQIGVEPGPELRRIEAAVLAQDESLLAPPVAAAPDAPIGDGFRRRGNVRYPVGRCFGRADEVELLKGLVERHRLVTLTGPGGVGKTRLALELCMALKDDVADGVWWVELAAARNEADVLSALHRSLRMDVGTVTDPQSALNAVVTALADRAAILVLDNCEHVLSAVVPVVEELLGSCGHLRVLATSREGLDVSAERLFAVVPLHASAAVELFEARCGGSVEEGGSAAAILEICERLDRLPLALELAAARTRHLRLEEIRDRLSNRFELLRDGARTMQAHQRNLRAVADWSYELLEEPERVVFERLSVFADGATVDSARQVCATPDVARADVERLLDRLVDKSLVLADRSGGRTRFRMLQTLADYASERLDLRGSRDETLRAHAQWALALARTVEFGARTDGATVASVQDEDVAIRDAIGWSLASDPTVALQMCDALSAFWFGTMRVSVGWEWLSAALFAAELSDPALRASASAWATVFATMVQDIATAQRHADSALSFERALGDPARLGKIGFALAIAAGYRSDSQAAEWIAEARRHFADAGVPVGLGHASFAEGAAHLVCGEIDAAAVSLRSSITIFREQGDHLGLILAVSRLGELSSRQGDTELFAEMHAELLELGLASRSGGVIAGATARLAHARLIQGDIDEAQRLARTALASSSESFMPIVNGYAFRSAGLVNLRLGHVPEGRGHLRAAIEAFEQGAGNVGVGQAALCWIDLSESCSHAGETDDARWAAEKAVEIANAAGDPWVREQADAQMALIAAATLAP
ncbi:MAG: BTAD domain-containing putative transcriptional regulator [Acidimicrobiales bacterium]